MPNLFLCQLLFSRQYVRVSCRKAARNKIAGLLFAEMLIRAHVFRQTDRQSWLFALVVSYFTYPLFTLFLV